MIIKHYVQNGMSGISRQIPDVQDLFVLRSVGSASLSLVRHNITSQVTDNL